MGVVETIAVVTAVASFAQGISAQQDARKEAKRRAAFNERQADRQEAAQKEQSAAERERNAVSRAEEQNREAAQRRRAVRERRIRTASILQQAQGAGVAGSSGALSSGGVLGTNLGAQFSRAASQTKASQGVADANQRISDASRITPEVFTPRGSSTMTNVLGGIAGLGSLAGTASQAELFKGPNVPKARPLDLSTQDMSNQMKVTGPDNPFNMFG